mmetsp:Transcript_59720/g.169256  ORF Transcript_59720/g.169256 Transcript_59720/m.169256 type:complete len:214 (-) Transcript_59720:151-792(-)
MAARSRCHCSSRPCPCGRAVEPNRPCGLGQPGTGRAARTTASAELAAAEAHEKVLRCQSGVRRRASCGGCGLQKTREERFQEVAFGITLLQLLDILTVSHSTFSLQAPMLSRLALLLAVRFGHSGTQLVELNLHDLSRFAQLAHRTIHEALLHSLMDRGLLATGDTEVDWRFFRGQDLGLPKRNAAIGAGRSGGGSLTRAGPSRIAGHRRHGR